MNHQFRKAVKQQLCDYLMDGIWGDGQEAEYIMAGINFKGLDNMSDQELIEELKLQIGADSPDFDPDMEDKIHVLYLQVSGQESVVERVNRNAKPPICDRCKKPINPRTFRGSKKEPKIGRAHV